MGSRVYISDFDNARRKAFVRSRSQAWFRGETWELTWEDYQVFWKTTSRWARRSRRIDGLVLTRRDWQGVWNRDNCCIITRKAHLGANGSNRVGNPTEQYFAKAIWYGQ
jgi:hypothetical protein